MSGGDEALARGGAARGEETEARDDAGWRGERCEEAGEDPGEGGWGSREFAGTGAATWGWAGDGGTARGWGGGVESEGDAGGERGEA